MRTLVAVLGSLALTSVLGCSIVDSSGSLSDSISSPSKSISDSSSGDDDSGSSAPETPQDTSSYRRDISQLTVTYIKSGGDIDAFRSAISDLAKARGLTNWEADPDTTQAVGVGAGDAGLQESAFKDFGASLFGDDLMTLNELRKGYQQSAPIPAVAAPRAEATGSEPESNLDASMDASQAP